MGKIKSHQISPTIGTVRSTSSIYPNSAVFIDVPNCSITITTSANSNVLIMSTFDVSSSVAGDVIVGQILLNGVAQSGQAISQVAAINERKTIGQIWLIPLTIGTHTLKLQIARNTGTGTVACFSTHTQMTYLLLAS